MPTTKNPAQQPSEAAMKSAAATIAVPEPLTPDQLQRATKTSAATAGEPLLGPHASGATLAAAGGAGTWQGNQTIGALWSSNDKDNAYAWINGIGWTRLAPTSDASLMAMNILTRVGRDSGSPINYREEADGAIHEIYLW
jgi:hypothetical protein